MGHASFHNPVRNLSFVMLGLDPSIYPPRARHGPSGQARG